jgi:histidinol-phosphate aminotransferase
MSVPVYEWEPATRDVAARAGVDPAQVIRFDQNTAPFPPPWAAEEAALAAFGINEYPDADYLPLRTAVAAYAGVSPDQVVTGAGADELIDLCAKAFLPAGGTAVDLPPSYPMFRIATAGRGATLREVGRRMPGFRPDDAELVEAARQVDLVWMCVPNNPTGHRDPDDMIRAVVRAASGVVVIDGAYAEYAGDRWGKWITQHPNLVVLGTLSKAFGLAGIRVGYSISDPDLAAALHGRRPPGSISTVSAAVAARALHEQERAMANVAAVTAERTRVRSELERLGIRVHPSVANFLLVELGPQASRISRSLMWERGLVVRSFSKDGPLGDHLRFTIRSADENDRLLAALEEVTS